MKIRKATKKDLKTLIELSDQLLLDHAKRFSTGPKLAKDFHTPKVKYYRSLMTKRNAVFFVAEEKGTVVGFILGKEGKDPPIFAETRIGKIEELYILPKFRDKGIGRRLFAELKKWFKKRKYKTIEITFYSENKKAKRLYYKLGFRPHKKTWRMKI
ncbi:MAG: GNAT family N-acetyltransferase [Candidatus Bilamarchaeaceae archaeon]